jgi:hypothetical protein
MQLLQLALFGALSSFYDETNKVLINWLEITNFPFPASHADDVSRMIGSSG